MANTSDTTSMALFCDFENVALGVRDAKYEKFDIKPVLERLLAKGSIVVKKAYCDWERYKGFKATMHEANFELIEIPHVRQSGKNSADIRMVVDALDLCYTKAHVDTFVIISGDSDFSPLVSKLRENAKQVIGVGVKQSTSDLLIANCDEFIFYDDLVREREAQRANVRREQQQKRSPEEERTRREELEAKRAKAIELAAATFDDLIAVRGDAERIWASALKEAIRRRNPGFNESYYGYRTFGALLDDVAARGLVGVGRDEKSGTFVTRAAPRSLPVEPVATAAVVVEAPAADEATPAAPEPTGRSRGRGRGNKAAKPRMEADVASGEAVAIEGKAPESPAAVDAPPAATAESSSEKPSRTGARRRKSPPKPAVEAVQTPGDGPAPTATVEPADAPSKTGEQRSGGKASSSRSGAKKASPRGSRRPRAKSADESGGSGGA